MFQTRNEYDRGVNTFSPEGRLFQVEYAMEAIKLGSTAVGIRTAQGVVLAVEKRSTSPLMVSSSVEKIMEVDFHIGCAMSGLIADARTLVEHARVECQNHRFTYNEALPLASATQSICDMALRFGETGGDDDDDAGGMSRPFGVALLLAGWDPSPADGVSGTGPALYHTDPSGTFVKYDAKAIGSGADSAQTQLQDNFKADMTLEEAETLALSTLKAVMEEKVTPTNVEIASVAPTYRQYTVAEVEAVLARL